MAEVFLNEAFDESAMFEEVSSEDAMRLWGIDLSKPFETFDEEDVVDPGNKALTVDQLPDRTSRTTSTP